MYAVSITLPSMTGLRLFKEKVSRASEKVEVLSPPGEATSCTALHGTLLFDCKRAAYHISQ